MSCSSCEPEFTVVVLSFQCLIKRACFSVEWARLPKMRVRGRILPRSTGSTWTSRLSRQPLFLFSLVPAYPLRFCFRYVVNAAKAAKADKDQRLIYISVRSPFHSRLTCYHMLPAGAHRQSRLIDILLA